MPDINLVIVTPNNESFLIETSFDTFPQDILTKARIAGGWVLHSTELDRDLDGTMTLKQNGLHDGYHLILREAPAVPPPTETPTVVPPRRETPTGPPPPPAMKRHVRIVAIVDIVVGSLGILVTLVILVFFVGMVGATRWRVGLLEIGIAFGVVAALSITCLIAGIGLLKYREWGRILTIVMSIVSMVNIPLGTIWGIYGLWVMLNDETVALLKPGNAVSKAPARFLGD